MKKNKKIIKKLNWNKSKSKINYLKIVRVNSRWIKLKKFLKKKRKKSKVQTNNKFKLIR